MIKKEIPNSDAHWDSLPRRPLFDKSTMVRFELEYYGRKVNVLIACQNAYYLIITFNCNIRKYHFYLKLVCTIYLQYFFYFVLIRKKLKKTMRNEKKYFELI